MSNNNLWHNVSLERELEIKEAMRIKTERIAALEREVAELRAALELAKAQGAAEALERMADEFENDLSGEWHKQEVADAIRANAKAALAAK